MQRALPTKLKFSNNFYKNVINKKTKTKKKPVDLTLKAKGVAAAFYVLKILRETMTITRVILLSRNVQNPAENTQETKSAM